MYPRILSVLVFTLSLALVSAGPLYAASSATATPKPSTTVTAPNPPNDSTTVTAPNPSGNGGGLVNPLDNINSLEDLLAKVLDAVVELGVIAVTLALVFVGFKFVAAQGREEELKNAKAALLWTVVGGLILLGVKAIALVIQETGKAL